MPLGPDRACKTSLLGKGWMLVFGVQSQCPCHEGYARMSLCMSLVGIVNRGSSTEPSRREVCLCHALPYSPDCGHDYLDGSYPLLRPLHGLLLAAGS